MLACVLDDKVVFAFSQADILLAFSHKLLDKVVHHSVVEILSPQMRITSCGLHVYNAVCNGRDGHIEGSTIQVDDEHISFTSVLKQVIAYLV
ncbi:hypothetical protein DPMN_194832 [Dreissena polymorpha]|uniref:Uncharacterized protein n=1 Tax=Dreissena polymorpha TaxID=45954 RepID=A0A9D3Y1V1_DREPO|nr:hypothetical protein DPMN_194832 [Dreissena polymorpha]